MLSIAAAVLTLAGTMAMASSAQANDRELYLYYTHTKETIRIVYKSNGRFVQSALERLNVFLRDWRRNEPAQMDPALFDVLWEVYQRTGASEPIHIVSAYRSPATNAMLASNSSGVADNSQHMRGKAIDFFIPGIPVNRIRELGFVMQVGGVGYYPNSGSPFVHLDTGSVRAWPRMTTAQLQQLFPDGRTMHISSSGQTLPGYQVAKAEWDRCHRVPCNASVPSGGSTQVASGDRPRTLWDLFTGGNDNASAPAPSAPVQVASAPAPQPPAPQAAPTATPAPAAGPVQLASSGEPPAPPVRPADLIAGTMVADAPVEPQDIPFQIVDAQDMIAQVAMASETEDAPMPPSISRGLAEMRAATPSAYAPTGGRLEVAATEPTAPTPIARPDFAPVITASLSPQAISAAEPLEMRPSIDPDAMAASQPHEPSELDAFASLFDGAVLPGSAPQAPDAAMTNAVASLTVADGQLFAPGLETVTDTLMAPTALSGDQFAFGSTDALTVDDSDTVLASGFTRTAALGHSSNTFGPAQTIWVHYDSASN